MKIRGTTVGTSIKPERVLSKPVTLSEEQKAQARENIGACEINDDQVRMDKTWSSAQIQAELVDVYAEIDTCVRHSPQEKTEEEKAQARKNIGAIGDGDYVTELAADFLGVADSEDPSAPGMKRGAYIRYLRCREDGTDNIILIGTESATGDVAIGGVAHGIEDTDAVNVKQLKDAELRMVDKLCPSFTESGAVVTCEPVEGYPLTVTAEETATITRCGKNLFNYKDWIAYANSAYPSTNHVAGEVEYLGRKCFSYRVYRSIKDMHFTNIRFKPNTQYTIKLQMAMQYGSNTEYKLPALLFMYTDGTSSYVPNSETVYTDKFVEFTVTSTARKTISHLTIPNFAASGIVYIPVDSCVITEGTTAEYAPYTGETFAQGEQIPAVQGINNLWADSGLLTVSGKADPVARLEKLENAILAMGANV